MSCGRVWAVLAFFVRAGRARRVWWVLACARAGAWRMCGRLRVWVCFWRASVVLCVRVAWINGKGREEGTNANRFPPLSLFFFCGADDGNRTRCLHLGRVVLRLLSFIRSVCTGRSLGALAHCFSGFGADDGNRTRVICLEGRGSTIELHPHVAPPRFACGFCLPGRARLALVSIHLAYKCRWCAGVSSTPRCCNIGHSFSSLSAAQRRKRSARLLTAYWRDVAVSGMLRLKS